MNNKDFIAELSRRSGYSVKETTEMINSFIGIITEHLQDDNVIAINNFGMFDVKKKMERISVNPVTQQRMLVPPKLVVNFKPSSSLKDKMK